MWCAPLAETRFTFRLGGIFALLEAIWQSAIHFPAIPRKPPSAKTSRELICLEAEEVRVEPAGVSYRYVFAP